ncbi:MAG: MarP family serine protease [Nocardioidaceae bacterium]
MNALDVVLVLCALVYALTGYHQGFLIGSCATAGLMAGGFAGIQVAPWVLGGFADSLTVSVTAMGVVLVLAFIGQGLGALVGQLLRRKVVWRSARAVDSLSGAALSVAAMLVIAWVLGVAASGARIDGINEEVRQSAVLRAVDEAMPGGTDRLLSAFSAVVGSSDFPRYLEPFRQERITAVRAPNQQVIVVPGVEHAARSVVKILGDAPSCSKTMEGSGFVYAPHRVMTNAHVVAGVERLVVRLDDTDHAATVVYYDPDIDVAVLAVPDLAAPSLRFADEARSGAPAAVLGYPQDGPFDAEPGRIRSVERLRSPNIYGDETVVREAYAVYALVREGNSGGPLVTPGGRVLGVVFAASVVDDNTGYALSVTEVQAAAAAGAHATRLVSTQDCTP